MTSTAHRRGAALVTGGTRGIGLGIAQALAAEGFDLCLCGRRPTEQVRDVLDKLSATGQQVVYHACDIGEAGQRADLLEAMTEGLGPLNVLINNAGVAPRVRADLLEATEEEYEWVMRVNLQGPYFLTQAVARRMIATREKDPQFQAYIVNVGSISATLASLNRGEYCLSKAGMAMATTLWALRLATYNIPVYEVRPGITATDMTRGVKEKYDRLIAEGLVPQRRWGHPEDIGRAVAALVRGDLAYSTGQVITVDGGLTLPRL
jgi:3-oxoacyl-[acyl-carrier protein] reductase